MRRPFFREGLSAGSADLGYVSSPGALLTFLDFESDHVVFGEALEAAALDYGMMDEYVRRAVIRVRISAFVIWERVSQ